MPLAPDPAAVDLPADVAGDTTSITVDDAGGGGSTVTQTPAVPAVPGTPSWLTGEFYAAIAPGAAAVVGAVTGHHVVPDDIERQLVAFGTVAVMVFTFGRLLLKAVHVHGVASVARAQAIAAARTTPAGQVNLDAVAAVAARHANADPAAIATAVADELDRRARRPARKAR